MKRLGRSCLVALLAQCAVVGVLHARAMCLPDPSICSVPTFIPVVGTQGGVPDPTGLFSILVRGYGDVPMSGVLVSLDFSNVKDVRLCSTQPAMEMLDCAYHMIRGITDAQGKVDFLVLGAGRNRGGDPGDSHANVVVYADGVRLGEASATAVDENGAITSPGVEASDLSALVRDIGLGTYVVRSDFNRDGGLGGADLSVWLASYSGARSRTGCPSSGFCP